MLEYLEELPAAEAAAARRHLDFTELTVLSVRLGRNRALVLTNRKLLLIEPGLFGFGRRASPIARDRIKGVEAVGDRGLVIRADGDVFVPVHGRSRAWIEDLVARILANLDGPGSDRS